MLRGAEGQKLPLRTQGPKPLGSMFSIIGYLGFGFYEVVQVLGKYMLVRYLDP